VIRSLGRRHPSPPACQHPIVWSVWRGPSCAWSDPVFLPSESVLKPARRYTILVADRTTGVVRRVTIAARPAVVFACAVVTLPVLVGIGAAWKAKSDVVELYASERALEQENASYRTATAELSSQIQSLQSAITDLGARAALDPGLARAMETLPAFVKSRAMGGNVGASPKQEATYTNALTALANPEDTFGLLRTLLEGLESRLDVVQRNVERRSAQTQQRLPRASGGDAVGRRRWRRVQPGAPGQRRDGRACEKHYPPSGESRRRAMTTSRRWLIDLFRLAVRRQLVFCTNTASCVRFRAYTPRFEETG